MILTLLLVFLLGFFTAHALSGFWLLPAFWAFPLCIILYIFACWTALLELGNGNQNRTK
ncbi:hypothetical protein HC928_06235 [bacterium]|nr:hypothetical protein [bacterium]